MEVSEMTMIRARRRFTKEFKTVSIELAMRSISVQNLRGQIRVI